MSLSTMMSADYHSGVPTVENGPPTFPVSALLDGHEFDLQDMADLFPSGDPIVVPDNQGFWLASSRMEIPGRDIVTIQEAAERLLAAVNGAARVQNINSRAVKLTGRYLVDGVERAIVSGSAELRGRGTLTATLTNADGNVLGDVTPQPNQAALRAVVLAEAHPDVAEALELLAGELDWVNLYKVYEIVRDSVGSQQRLKRRGYASDGDMSAFTVSANDPSISGSSARHARLNQGRPRRTMTLPEGREFVRALVDRWLNHLGRGGTTLPGP